MSLILNIETATKNCSVALSENGKALFVKELDNGDYSHAEMLHVFVGEAVKQAGKKLSDLSAIAVSKGPGSFTGLRIGVSAAKGLCFSLDIPLISINTLQALAAQVHVEDGVIIPMIDARRMEVYSAVYDIHFNEIREIKAEVIEENIYDDYLAKGKVFFIGDAVAKVKDVITHPNAVFVSSNNPSAKEMAIFSSQKFESKTFEDVAYFEPFYLKDFVVNKPKSKSKS